MLPRIVVQQSSSLELTDVRVDVDTAPGRWVGPNFEIFRGGSAVVIPFVVWNSDAARFEGTVRF